MTDHGSKYTDDDEAAKAVSSGFAAVALKLQNFHKAHRELMGFVKEGNADTVQPAIEEITHVLNPTDENGKTPLTHVLNSPDENGYTALMIAANLGHKEVVAALLEAGADVTAADKAGRTPLMMAAYNGDLAVVTALLKKEAKKQLTAADTNGMTPLLWATQEGHKEVVATLLEAGADVDAAKSNGLTPLMIAANLEHKEVVAALLEAGADVNKAIPEESSHAGYTPLHFAAENGNVAVVELLLANGIDDDKAFNKGNSPWRLAEGENHADVFLLLSLELGPETIEDAGFIQKVDCRKMLKCKTDEKKTTADQERAVSMKQSKRAKLMRDPNFVKQCLYQFKDKTLWNHFDDYLKGFMVGGEEYTPAKTAYEGELKKLGLDTWMKKNVKPST